MTVVGSSWEALELACWLQEVRNGIDKVRGLFCSVEPDREGVGSRRRSTVSSC